MNRGMPDLEAYIRQGQQQSASLIKGGLLLLEVEPGRGRARFALRNVSPAQATGQILDLLVTALSVSGQMLNLQVLQHERKEKANDERG